MSLAESVDLVRYAFTEAENGDLFVRKAPASTVGVLAQAVANVLGVKAPRIEVIGVRHGEKLYESLLSSEERVRAEDRGGYFRVPLDTRSLNYGAFVDYGDQLPATDEAYTSHNTDRLEISQVEDLLRTLPEVRSFIGAQ